MGWIKHRGKRLFTASVAGVEQSFAIPLVAVIAGDATAELAYWSAPWACELVRVDVVAHTTLTGANTNSMNLNVVDKGAAGAGTDEVVSKEFISGVNATAAVRTNLGTLSTTHKILAGGDVVAIQREKVGTGLAMPALEVVITVKHRTG